MTFRIGSDPEVFLMQGNKFLSSIGRVGGSKDMPRPLNNMPEGFSVQEDNVAVEFGVPPASTEDEFVANIFSVQEAVLKELPKDITFSKLSCVSFPEEEMQDPRAYIFGCEPDYNAWTGKQNRFRMPRDKFLRSAGGHIHVQLEEGDDPNMVVKYMDLFQAVPSTLMDVEGAKRRELYGKMGACRYKPYGVEYRTLSNYWIFDEELIRWVYQTTKEAVDFAREDFYDINSLHNRIADAVNNNNYKQAEKLCKEFNL